jgi:hypothetical protein
MYDRQCERFGIRRRGDHAPPTPRTDRLGGEMRAGVGMTMAPLVYLMTMPSYALQYIYVYSTESLQLNFIFKYITAFLILETLSMP